jgi:plastocyanin
MRYSRFIGRAALALCGTALAFASACGGETNDAAAVQAATVAPAAASTHAGMGAGSTLTIAGLDNKWDTPSLKVKAGEHVSLTFENKGQALHNWHVTNVKGADGKDITTQLLAGGKAETVMFTIEKAGSYDYICDVHPVEMKGRIVVE